MESAVFFQLAYRLPAYSGAMAAVAARQAQGGGGSTGSTAGRGPALKYERNSAAANNARSAASASPATAASIAAADAQLGGGWIAYRKVKPGGGEP